MLIGISGKIKSGKDECGNILLKEFQKRNKSAKIVKIADAVKDIACIITGLTREQIEDRTIKEKPLGPLWNYWSYENKIFLTKEEAINILAKTDTLQSIKQIELTPRKLLTLIGTSCGRKIIHPNIWINSTFKNYTKEQDWIITDVRFPNEVKKIKELGGHVINISRNDSLKFPLEYKQFEDNNIILQQKETFNSYLYKSHNDLFNAITHESEISLDNTLFDYNIKNNFSLDHLQKELLLITQKWT